MFCLQTRLFLVFHTMPHAILSHMPRIIFVINYYVNCDGCVLLWIRQ